jgi:hypothetical protein
MYYLITMLRHALQKGAKLKESKKKGVVTWLKGKRILLSR